MDSQTDNASEKTPSVLASLFYLAVFLVTVFVVAGVGASVTATSIDSWYPTLAKPPLLPPNWAFPVVWNILYFMMALSAWLVWRRTGNFDAAGMAFSFFGIQLFLNLGWSLVFFGLQKPLLAVFVIIALLLAIAGTIWSFWRFSKLAALLLAPYFIWTLFAAYLTIAITILNP